MTVVWAFDTLGYAKRLQEAGVPKPQAEGHAEAAREFIMIELVTKPDLHAELDNLGTQLRTEIGALRAELRTEVSSLRVAIDTQTLRLTVRLGGIVAAGIGILALLGRLH
jgi:hypothetical protein